MAKAAASGILSAVVVMAWTGVYLSRHPRSSANDTTYNTTTISTPFAVANDVNAYVVSENDTALRRDKVKEVKYVLEKINGPLFRVYSFTL